MLLSALHSLLTDQPPAVLFAVIASGLMLGGIGIRGIRLGSSGVLFTALIAGHLGFNVPAGIGPLGLVLFVYCIGIGAGDRFFSALAREGSALARLAILLVVIGAAVTWIGARLLGLPAGLAAGLFAGALTSTPALAAATEGMGPAAEAVSIGYGIAYPFGVVGVVLFVQLLLKSRLEPETAAGETKDEPDGSAPAGRPVTSLLSLSVGLTLGILLGRLPIPLPGGATLRLGLAGGPLLVALVLGHFRRIGPIAGHIPRPARMLLQELGLLFFLADAGVRGGGPLVDTLREHGAGLFVLGACVTLLPLLIAWPVATRLLHLSPLQALGGICGGMTSTPALGAITSKTEVRTPTISYAAAYPVALIFMIFASKLLLYLIGN